MSTQPMSTPPAMRIVLVDDHGLFRAGIRALLRDIAGVEVVGEADDGHAGIEAVRALRPDIAIMDISMKRMTGLEATRRLRDEAPDTRVIMLSMFSEADYVLEAMRAGARGYLIKDAATQELAVALAAVMRGETYISPAISRHLVDGAIQRRSPAANEPSPLTARQLQILKLIAEGNATKEIAHDLGLSVKTVEAHRAQIMDRLGIRDVAGLVRYAIRIGLVSAGT